MQELDEMEKGFIKLHRKFFSNELWKEARTFSSCEAWLDLIQSARFDATPRTESIGGREVSYGRGQYPASIRFLAKKWMWSDRKVRTFLDYLKKRKMITTDSQQGQNIITLCNFDQYNSAGTAKDTVADTDILNEINKLRDLLTQQTTQQPTQYRHTVDTNNKNDKEREESNPPSIPPQAVGSLEEDKFLSSPLSKMDGKPRNLEGMIKALEALHVSGPEINRIVWLSNQGEIGHLAWKLIAEARDSKGIKMPGRFIISRLLKPEKI